MVAFHFPPVAGSSGLQRTLSFARYLPRYGWTPLILTAHPRAYERVSVDQLQDLPPGTVVERAFALDASRDLAVLGRYPAFLARPDRWLSWWPGAVIKGMTMIKRFRPDAIWSTYPIATAHRIGRTLQRFSGLPWIADFRDPMAQDRYPAEQKTWHSFKKIEEAAVRNAAFAVCATSSAAASYRARYADVQPERLMVIENGYDEDSFSGLDACVAREGALLPETFTLVHSGLVYPSERDPTALFLALRQMLDAGLLRPGELRIRLRAAGHEGFLGKLIGEFNLEAVVELAPPLPYRDALLEMMRADGLLVLQAANCNAQVPAKLYEYLRCRRPILGLTDPAGDTAAVLRRSGVRDIARLDSKDEIAAALRTFLDLARRGEAALPARRAVDEASRLNRTGELASLLNVVCHAEPITDVSLAG